MIPRKYYSLAILKFAKKYPVISVTGPRQSGKTTLVRSLFPKAQIHIPGKSGKQGSVLLMILRVFLTGRINCLSWMKFSMFLNYYPIYRLSQMNKKYMDNLYLPVPKACYLVKRYPRHWPEERHIETPPLQSE